jgi:hypothetical protein
MSLPDRNARHSYTFQITLLGVTPPVWRLVAAPGRLTLAQLHEVIQLAMGWQRAHPYRFDIASRNYEEKPRANWPSDTVDPRGVTLDELDLTQGSSLTYLYDFKDDWIHHLTVQGVAPFAPALDAPALLGGAGACPPEASGGPGGYAALLGALRQPESPAGRSARERLGPITDPAVWEPGSTAAELPGIGAPPAGPPGLERRSKKDRRGRR